jgi:GNAT superfamily N-acetyltransferase
MLSSSIIAGDHECALSRIQALSKNIIFVIREARYSDSEQIASLMLEWLSFRKERISIIKRSIKQGEILVATENDDAKSLAGFIHGIVHNDLISGGKRLFVTAFYVKPKCRNKGLGTRTLKYLIQKEIERDRIVGVEVSTTRKKAAMFYQEKFGFFQVKGDIGEIFLSLDV